MKICDNCDSQKIFDHSEIETYSYKNKSYQIDVKFSVCGTCNEEFLDRDQILANESQAREAKKRIDGLLSAQELKDIRKSLNLTQAEASEVFGGGANAFSKYERMKVTQSKSLDKLLRIASEDSLVFTKLLKLAGYDKTKFMASDPTAVATYFNEIIGPKKLIVVYASKDSALRKVDHLLNSRVKIQDGWKIKSPHLISHNDDYLPSESGDIEYDFKDEVVVYDGFFKHASLVS